MVHESQRFILGVSCSNEYLDGFDYFVVDIEPEYAQQLLKRIELLRFLKKQDGDVYELYFWDYQGDFYGGDPDEHGEGREPSSAECTQLVVRENDAFWTAIPKHSDIYVTTDSIRVDQLAEIAASHR